jgi:hypothetical protein
MQLLSELYAAKADFNFNVDTTHRETFQTVLSINQEIKQHFLISEFSEH